MALQKKTMTTKAILKLDKETNVVALFWNMNHDKKLFHTASFLGCKHKVQNHLKRKPDNSNYDYNIFEWNIEGYLEISEMINFLTKQSLIELSNKAIDL